MNIRRITASGPFFYCNKSLKAKRLSVYKGPVHTNPDTFETAYFFFLQNSLPSTRNQWTAYFETAFRSGFFFWIRRIWLFRVDDWQWVFWCQLRHKCEFSLKWKLSNSKWWTLHRLYNVLFATLLALIAILIACVPLIWRQQLAISKDWRLNLILIMKSLSSRRRPEPRQSQF